ncbi:hypothetical protein [Ornithinibacillus sp. JPR2-1]|uniref:hypothetical protein n=1 Tax=Ornithinibacillus sp. JPR2-1 TaxID=2094019 RepID=UPI0031D18007
MLIVFGLLSGVIISLIGSFIISLVPWIPFVPVFLTTVIPSVLIFVILTFRIKPDASKLVYWVNSFIALFIIGFLTFLIRNYFQWRAVAHIEGSGLVWDAVILFNILYSLGAALVVSPIGYLVIKWIAQLKKQYL